MTFPDPLSADYDGLPGDPPTPAPRLARVDLIEEAETTAWPAQRRAAIVRLVERVRAFDLTAEERLRALLS